MSQMLQAYEGYLEEGRVHTVMPIVGLKDRRRVIITVLDEPLRETQDTWAELDRVVAEMGELPRFEDFPRCDLGRELINFEEV